VNDDEARQLRERCTRHIHGHGPVTAADLLATIPPDTEIDRYGAGGVVGDLEREIAQRLGKPAAVFFPSGTMAQQVTLRVQAERRGRRTVVFHPTCHLVLHEGGALERLQGLVSRPAGDANRRLTAEDLRTVAEPVAALLVELPQREIGGGLPEWDDLVAQVGWARDRGAATHLDGARLWEASAGYGREPIDVAALFDTVYVSFYKAVGALPGCCVAGPDDVVAELREWRKRMGGTLFALWPNAASARTCLAERLPRMPAYLARARAVAEALAGVAGVRVVPDPPQVSMMHLLLDVSADDFDTNVRTLAADDGVWTWATAASTVDAGTQRVELTVGDATLQWDPKDLADVVARLVSAR
jgi:threonine aldolase